MYLHKIQRLFLEQPQKTAKTQLSGQTINKKQHVKPLVIHWCRTVFAPIALHEQTQDQCSSVAQYLHELGGRG
jgi:hypothetical protein